MAYSEKDGKPVIDIVDETLELFDKYSSKRDNWAQQAKEDKEFRLGRQWTSAQRDLPSELLLEKTLIIRLLK